MVTGSKHYPHILRKTDEVADFPTLDRRMVKIGGKLSIYKLSIYKLSDGKPFLEDGA